MVQWQCIIFTLPKGNCGWLSAAHRGEAAATFNELEPFRV
jgi:hypothetical protein